MEGERENPRFQSKGYEGLAKDKNALNAKYLTLANPKIISRFLIFRTLSDCHHSVWAPELGSRPDRCHF